jgi:cytochrome c-type biogenesis protein CcmE
MSKKLDDELANAAGLDESADTGHAGEAAPAQGAAAHASSVEANGPSSTPGLAAAAHSNSAGRSVGLLAMLLVMVGAVVALFLVGFKDAAVYSTPIDQVDKAGMVGRKVRLEGELVPGTLVKRDQPCEYRFKIHGEKAELPVHYAQCVIPDTFRDIKEGGVQVTVEGALNKSGEFEATLIMAKCTSKYNPDTHEMKDGKKGMPSAESMPIN